MAYQYTPTHTPYAYSGYAGYAYQPTGYQTQWYPYGYVPQQQLQHRPIANVPTAAQPVSTPSTPTPAPARQTTFTTYTPNTYQQSSGSGSHGTSTGATAASSSGPVRSTKKANNTKGLFTRELRNLMYGFGDDKNPANDTVSVMEEILIEYITDVCLVAGGPSKKTRLSVDDLRRALSRPEDAKKLARMEELLFMQEDIKRARAQFEDTDNVPGAKATF